MSLNTTYRGLTLLPMTVAQAEAIAGRLGHPSKMPGWSYGLSAKLCRRGGELDQVAGSVCNAQTCYAKSNFYRTWAPLHVGHRRRRTGIEHPLWVDAMVTMITVRCRPPHDYFRWHDSGDLQVLAGAEDGVRHLARIVEVCRRTPQVRHWLPTREYLDVARYLGAGGEFPPNLVVRLSATMIDEAPRLPEDLAGMPTSTVHTGETMPVEGKGAVECRAVELRENKCGACRACWDPRVLNVSYPQH